MDDVAGADAVGGDEDFRMHAGAEEVDGNHRWAARMTVRVESLTEQHLETLQGRMTMAADRMADDLGGNHLIDYGLLNIDDSRSAPALIDLSCVLSLVVLSLQMILRFSTRTQRRTRVKVLGVVMPSPVVVAME